MLNTLYIILLIALILAIPVTIIRRKRLVLRGVKSALTSICLFLIVITNLLAYLFDYFSLLVWSIGFV